MLTNRFTEFLLRQSPVYDREILKNIRPTDGWILPAETGPQMVELTEQVNTTGVPRHQKLAYIRTLRVVRDTSEKSVNPITPKLITLDQWWNKCFKPTVPQFTNTTSESNSWIPTAPGI